MSADGALDVSDNTFAPVLGRREVDITSSFDEVLVVGQDGFFAAHGDRLEDGGFGGGGDD